MSSTLLLQLSRMLNAQLAEIATIAPLLATGAGILRGVLSDDRREQMLDELIQERRGVVQRLSRISRGEFSPQEIRDIEQSPILGAIGQSATARGVQGPARQQLIARAQQGLASQQQAAATQALSPALGGLQQSIEALPEDDLTPFFNDISATVQSIALAQQLRQLPGISTQGQGTNVGNPQDALLALDPVLEADIESATNQALALLVQGLQV